MPLTRRFALTMGLVPFLPLPLRAASGGAEVISAASGATAILPDASVVTLETGMGLPAGSTVDTGPAGPAELALPDGSRLNAGRQTRIALQTVTHREGGSLSVSGTLVIDRRAADPSTTLAVNSADFQVVLADAQVFIESLRGSAIFVREGKAQVRAPMVEVVLAAGEGIDLPPPIPDTTLSEPGTGASSRPDPAMPPPPPAPAPIPQARPWSDSRVSDAFESVGLSA